MAKKYIDADKLKALLRDRYYTCKIGQHSPFRSGKVETLRETIELIDSLQQEQECHGCFNRDEVFMRGMKYAKEQMLKEAVEGYVAQRVHGKLYAKAPVPDEMGLDFGDKVRIIIIKED